MSTVLYFIRHGQAQPLPHQSEPEWALSRRGEEQAQGLVPLLASLGIRRLYCSPFRRCRQTLEPYAMASGVELTLHEGLRERCLSPVWIGDFREVWERSWADLSYALAGGESSLACRERVHRAVTEIAQRHSGETLGLGSHGFAIGLFLTTIDPTCGAAEAGALRTPDVLKFVYDGREFRWERAFSLGVAFDRIATHFRETPGIVA
jgi:2,3-bisphosphoglycerate-dependent phosphoglycerate mutase